MKNLKWLLFLILANLGSASAQSLNEYKYVQVPVEYEFLSEENKYQLNALTAFLLEKYGFEVFYKEEIPGNIDFCDVLLAKVDNDSGLFTTKLQVKLETCKGESIFISKYGKSRDKDYKTAYHEALRDAFSSLDEIDYAYSGAEEALEEITVEEVKVVVTSEEPASEKLVAEKALPQVTEVEKSNASTKFRNGMTEYTLKKTTSGYILYKGSEEAEEFANLLRSGGGTNYIYSSNKVQGNAFFDKAGNLVVEYVDAATGQLVTVQYKVQD